MHIAIKSQSIVIIRSWEVTFGDFDIGISVNFVHEVAKDGKTCIGSLAQVGAAESNRGILRSHPNTSNQVGGHPDEPTVCIALGCAGFSC